MTAQAYRLKPTLSRSTQAGSVPAGAASVAFANAGTAPASVASGTLKPGEAISFSGTDWARLGEISYSAVGTELVMTEVR